MAQLGERALAAVGHPESIGDFFELDPSVLDRRSVEDARLALASCAEKLVAGLEFGARHAELTRRLVSNDIAGEDPMRKAIREELAKLGSHWAHHEPVSYEEWEKDILGLLDLWGERCE